MMRITVTVLILLAFLAGGCKRWLPDHEPKTVKIIPHDNLKEVHMFGGETIDQTTADAPELLGGAGTYYGEPVSIRAALHFDLEKIPADAQILFAKLTLYSNPTPLNGHGVANSGSNNSLVIQRITQDWEARAVSWANQPQTTSTDEILIPHTDVPFEDLEVDVTPLIKQMTAQDANYGFFIRLQQEEIYNYRIFCSSKYTNSAKHPKLVVTYKK